MVTIRPVIRSKTLRRVVKDYALSTAFWLSLSLPVGWQYALGVRQAHLAVSLSHLLILNISWFLTCAVLTPPLFYLIEAYLVRALNRWRRIAFYGVGYPMFTLVFACIRWALYAPWAMETVNWGPRSAKSLFQSTYTMFADELVFYLGIVLAGHAYFYFVRSQRQEREQMLMQQALTQSELQSLKRQMQPHFLFNTLHGIMTLVGSEPRRAQQMLLNLSNLLRRSMQEGNTDLVALDEDLRFAQDYLAIEKMRLGDRLLIRWDIAPDTLNLLIPQLVVQPLLENAIKHGIAPCADGGWLRVATRRTQDRLVLEVRNSTCSGTAVGSGVGHQNIQARLGFLFGAEAELLFECKGELACASVSLPALRGQQQPDGPAFAAAAREEEEYHANARG